ncbi:MAG: hypothetical protein K9M54_07325, partial [Kiritimatiellales bacterium]|nr:hypothetical protein [Kiritimatiellales bacterium]
MKKLVVWFVSFNLVCLAADEFRTFTAQDGRKLKAKVVSYDPASDKVQILRDDKKSVTVQSSAFSDADQKYIKTWSAIGIFSSPSKLALDISRNEVGTTKKEHNVDMTNVEDDSGDSARRGGGREDGIQTVATDKSTQYKYNLTLANKGGVPLDNLAMEYRIYYAQEKPVMDDKEKRPKGDLRPVRYLPVSENKVKGGKVKIGTIEAKGTKEVSTGSVTLLQRTANRRIEDKIDLKGELAGVWVKVYMKSPDGEMVERDIALP